MYIRSGSPHNVVHSSSKYPQLTNSVAGRVETHVIGRHGQTWSYINPHRWTFASCVEIQRNKEDTKFSWKHRWTQSLTDCRPLTPIGITCTCVYAVNRGRRHLPSWLAWASSYDCCIRSVVRYRPSLLVSAVWSWSPQRAEHSKRQKPRWLSMPIAVVTILSLENYCLIVIAWSTKSVLQICQVFVSPQQVTFEGRFIQRSEPSNNSSIMKTVWNP